jgi:raffinose/stachyose/melibiose transport system substrate-binding protein
MLSNSQRARALGVTAVVAAAGLVLTGCTTSGGDSGSTEISFLVDNTETTVAAADALVAAFEKANPGITVDVETRPGGADGDNIVKTRLQTGEMTDVFWYNSGSLLQALAPEKTLVDLSGEDFLANVSDTFIAGVTAGDGVFGVPVGNAMGGGILYNKAVYADLGLEVPLTWDDFESNNQAILDAGGVAPVIQTYGPESAWTSQLFLLGDNYNVLAAEPDFADEYTANKAHYADTDAARAGFTHLEEVYKKGYLNADYASATYADGLRMVAEGTGAHYPMLTFAVPEIVANYPDQADNVGFFAIPGDDADANGLTTWLSAGVYLAASSEHQDAAKKFLAFIASTEGCDAQTAAVGVSGPYFVNGCTLPADVPVATADMLPYFESGNTAPALEFISPVKGPNLPGILVEVGSGIRSAKDAAALYDEDVKKQAQQLGLEGW